MRVRAGVAQSGDAMATPSLYFGAAGQGLMDLHFWQATGDGAYLSSAISIGEGLLESSRRTPQGRFWSSQGKVFLGLGDGQSGIALFLSYLGVASGDARFLEAASQALDYDISHGIRVAGRLFWKNLADAPANASNSPHTRFGAAGIGTACLRHFAATGEVRFREIALECAYSVRSRVTNKLWQESGNAGFGEYMLDLACVLGMSVTRMRPSITPRRSHSTQFPCPSGWRSRARHITGSAMSTALGAPASASSWTGC